jgi:hypothetical protein
MSVPASPEEAREIINEIAEKYGMISPLDREQAPKSVLKALENPQGRLGASARMLVPIL